MMPRNLTNSGFWAGGHEEALAALEQEWLRKAGEIRNRIEQAEDKDERASLRRELRDLERHYAERARAYRDCRF